MVRRRDVLGCLFAIVLLWFIAIVRLVLDVCTHDFSSVFVYEGCIPWGTITVFIGCLMEVVVGSWFLQKFLLPWLFGHTTWCTFDALKQQKLVGFVAQIVVRSACAVQLLAILCGGWGTQLTLRDGLFAKYNAKAAYAELITQNVATSCAKAGMQAHDVAAMRAWFFSKYHMVAVHIWELAFIPGLTVDGWLHHLFVIGVAALGSSPDTFTGKGELQPVFDSIGFSFILGASLNFGVKVCVVMYHYTAPDALMQARWMEASIAGAWAILVLFYIGFPCLVAFVHAGHFGPLYLIGLVLLPIAFLSFIEIKLILVKRSIARNARRKALANSAGLTLQAEIQGSPRSRGPSVNSSHGSPRSLLSTVSARLDAADERWKEAQC